MNVVLALDDRDRHELPCECGRCNSQGTSYGVGVYASNDQQGDPLDRVYGPSEVAAFHNARRLVTLRGWKEVEAE